MKTGKTLTEMAAALEGLRESAQDFIVPNSALSMVSVPSRSLRVDPRVGEMVGQPPAGDDEEVPAIRFGEAGEDYPLTGWAHGQMASWAEIPKPYYDRLRTERPELLARNVNHGLERQEEASDRMIRTVGGHARAILSSRYRILDSYDLLVNALPIFQENALEVKACELTMTRMYIKALHPRLRAEVGVGDEVQYGIVISSSDVGAGSIRIEPLVYRLICLNGMISSTAMKKYHVGRDQSENEIRRLLTDETKELDDRVFWAKCVDVLRGSLLPENFNRQVDRLRDATEQKIENFDLPKVVKLAAARVGVSGERTLGQMVAYLANGADGAGLTAYGLSNAFTHAAQDEEIDYDRSIELERAGSRILDLDAAAWKEVAA